VAWSVVLRFATASSPPPGVSARDKKLFSSGQVSNAKRVWKLITTVHETLPLAEFGCSQQRLFLSATRHCCSSFLSFGDYGEKYFCCSAWRRSTDRQGERRREVTRRTNSVAELELLGGSPSAVVGVAHDGPASLVANLVHGRRRNAGAHHQHRRHGHSRRTPRRHGTN
jgi:hypothetical protein